ncbi:MAG: TnpV protein [Lachnospiraceae bacterium]|nr:TnpV protein [Lachnospiraceae bacterium]
MAIIDLEYTEIDGLLYPNIEIGDKELLDNLGTYGTLRLCYLYEHKPEMYRELLITGKLAQVLRQH